MRHCCKIDCKKEADVELIMLTGHFEDNTDACFDHIGELLGSTMTDKEWGTYRIEIVPIVKVMEPA